jgi:hypothetical protein
VRQDEFNEGVALARQAVDTAWPTERSKVDCRIDAATKAWYVAQDFRAMRKPHAALGALSVYHAALGKARV